MTDRLRAAAEAALGAMEKCWAAVADSAPHADVMGYNAAQADLSAALAEHDQLRDATKKIEAALKEKNGG